MKEIFNCLRTEIEENSVICGGANIVDLHTVRTLINWAESKLEEKHIAKTPLVNKCPCCSKTVFYVENYCPNCGQKLDWSVEDERDI